MIRPGWRRAVLWRRLQISGCTTTFIKPVSSSRLKKMTPLEVDGRCRWVTTPPTLIRGRFRRMSRASAIATHPARSRAGRAKSMGWRTDTPVAHSEAW